MTQSYSSPLAFKQALETRLRKAAAKSPALSRRRQRIVFERFLARISLEFGDAVILKGGLALELRMKRARTTRDVDLRITGTQDALLDRLRSALRRDLSDFMEFEIRPDEKQPKIKGEGMRSEGLRFKAECSIAGKIYGTGFGVDVAFAEPMWGAVDLALPEEGLQFAGIAPPRVRLYPIETHLAEKLHAYTMPREHENSRVKDLPDLAIIASFGPLSATAIRVAISHTFEFRGTHDVPVTLPTPPESWAAPYARIAEEDELIWRTLEVLFQSVRIFLDPVLSSRDVERWSPVEWRWE